MIPLKLQSRLSTSELSTVSPLQVSLEELRESRRDSYQPESGYWRPSNTLHLLLRGYNSDPLHRPLASADGRSDLQTP
jgi:hypothetical protein